MSTILYRLLVLQTVGFFVFGIIALLVCGCLLIFSVPVDFALGWHVIAGALMIDLALLMISWILLED